MALLLEGKTRRNNQNINNLETFSKPKTKSIFIWILHFESSHLSKQYPICYRKILGWHLTRRRKKTVLWAVPSHWISFSSSSSYSSRTVKAKAFKNHIVSYVNTASFSHAVTVQRRSKTTFYHFRSAGSAFFCFVILFLFPSLYTGYTAIYRLNNELGK